jgi:Leucine-rich repeat (LRR) protein
MARDEAYRQAEKKIEEARRSVATELSLNDMELTELPESLGQLPQLQSLDLSSNQLTALPESLGQLPQLQSLDLSSNQLTALPESLGQLTQLRSLNLSQNQLVALPGSLGQLTQLRSLNLSYNQLVALPWPLGLLTQLQSLDLSRNLLTALPESLAQLTRLRLLRQFTQLQSLNLSGNQLTALPEWLGQLTQLQSLDLSYNQLIALTESLGNLTQLKSLDLSHNKLPTLPEWLGNLTHWLSLCLSNHDLLPDWLKPLPFATPIEPYLKYPPTELPDWLGQLKHLQWLDLSENQLIVLPEWLGDLTQLRFLDLSDNRLTTLPEWLWHFVRLELLHLSQNQLTELPPSLAQLEHLKTIELGGNPLNPELAAAYEQGLGAVKAYLRAQAEAQITLNEAKLILVGEGEVGKSCLLGALRGNEWEEDRPTTHGIEIKPVRVIHTRTGQEITLNGWDFGGQRVYRPTHQLFFSSPAVYLVVWKPREGPQQGFVKEWIKLIKHREPDAKILVVATHGGPQERQPDIDRQELWDLFGRDTVIEFLHVESKPDENGERRGIEDLKRAIARVASSLPEVGRTVPKRWQDVHEVLEKTESAYLPLDRVLALCRAHHMDEDEARLFVTIEHRLGTLIHYEHDPLLCDIVVLKPDWLSTAISFVLDDEATRKAHGLVRFSHLSQLWNDPARGAEFRYPAALHFIFLRLMERFDLSYRVADPSAKGDSDPQSLIAQLVPDTRPEKDLEREWPSSPAAGDVQQEQICRIVDARNGQSAAAEGLFYQLIVRLHKYSLGRVNYCDSVHWQRGLVLDDDYNGRALLEYVGNDVRITVRAPYPERFLAMLTEEVKYLVESFWEGLRCDVMVPCIEPCGRNTPGTGLFQVEKLIKSKKNSLKYPCPVCDEWQDIDGLLRNAPAARPLPVEELWASFAEVKVELNLVRQQLTQQQGETVRRFDRLDNRTLRILSKVDDTFHGLMRALTDEAKEGPRLFSFQPIEPGFFDRPKWISSKFRLILWCEHARMPLPVLNEPDDRRGVYELTLPREWFVKAAPVLKVITGTLSLVLPVASSVTKLVLDEAIYKGIENQLDLGQKTIESVIKGGEDAGSWLGHSDAPDLQQGQIVQAQGAVLRELHTFLKEKDPSFGGLVRVMNKRQEFLWVHERFAVEY